MKYLSKAIRSYQNNKKGGLERVRAPNRLVKTLFAEEDLGGELHDFLVFNIGGLAITIGR